MYSPTAQGEGPKSPPLPQGGGNLGAAFQAVAVAGDGYQAVAPAEFGAQPAHEQIDAIGGDLGVVLVDLTQDLVAGDGDPGIPDEVFEELELERAKAYGLTLQPNLARIEVDLRVAQVVQGGRRRGTWLG